MLRSRHRRFGKTHCFQFYPRRWRLHFTATLITTYVSTRHHNPEEHLHPHYRENLKSHIVAEILQDWETRPSGIKTDGESRNSIISNGIHDRLNFLKHYRYF
jgi:hypothetical protein